MSAYHLFIYLFAHVLSVYGHGNMVWPPVWQDAGGKIGLTELGHLFIGSEYFFENDPEKSGIVSLWYTNYTFIVGKYRGSCYFELPSQ